MIVAEGARNTNYVSTVAELHTALDSLAPSAFLAIDTEFMRESTYYPKLCLLQVATLDYCAVIDPLALNDLSQLWSFLKDGSRLKILHAARQDLEVIAVSAPEAVPIAPIFDTQIAAALVGLSAQVGYGALVSARLRHDLAKGHTRADWSRRPLSAEQIEYAADDVRYLAPLYVDLRTELDSRDRLSWLQEEMRELEHPNLHKVEPQLAWRRLKGLERLRPEQRAAAKLLAQWREELAIRHDKPRGWILADEALREIAERMPQDASELAQLRTVPPGTVRKRGAELVELVAKGRASRDTESAYSHPPRPEPQQLALVTRLMSLVRSRAEEMAVSPELLATRKDVEQLVFSGKTEHLLEGWRAEAIGKTLVAEVS
jgi:ribonuclease D